MLLACAIIPRRIRSAHSIAPPEAPASNATIKSKQSPGTRRRFPALRWPPHGLVFTRTSANPIHLAMSNHPTTLGRPHYGHGRPCDRRIFAIAAVALVVASGCGTGRSALLPRASVEIIRGTDSAGATIELEKRGDDLTQARVIDVVLGTAEAEIIATTDRSVEFTIEFPGGVAITYRGQRVDTAAPGDVILSGTWRQHPGGVFAGDFGTWAAQSQTDDRP